MSWGLLREVLGPVDIRPVAEALAPAVGWTPIQAMYGMSIHQGVWFRGVDEDTARHLEEGLRALGIGAQAVPLQELVTPPRPRMVRNADLLPSGLEIQEPTRTFRLAWDQVGLVSVAALEETVTERRATPAIARPAGHHYWTPNPGFETAEFERTVDLWVLDLITADVSRWFRIRSTEFYYDYLGERRQPTSAGNFALLLRDLVHYAPDSRRAGAVDALLADPNARAAPERATLVDERIRWHCHWLRRGGPPLEIVI